MADEAASFEDQWNAIAKERESGAPQEPAPETPPQPPQDEPPELPEQTTATVPEGQPKPTELPPEVLAKLQKFDELAAVMPQLVNELREAKGRIGSLQSQWDKARQQVAAQPSAQQIAAAKKDPEKWNRLKSDFPDWGEAISEFVDTRLAGFSPSPGGASQEQIEQLVAARAQETTAAVVAEFNKKLVGVKHPGWEQEIKTPAFGQWFAQQPAQVQVLAESPDGLDAIRMLDLYAEAKAKPATAVVEDRQKRLDAAVSAPVKGAKSGATTKSFDDMSFEEQWNHLARQREKRA